MTSFAPTRFLFFCALSLTLTIVSQAAEPDPSLKIDMTPLAKIGACSGRFVAHDLDHVTQVPGGNTIRMFEANGGGVGINDIDNDGDLDIVLANHAGMNTILRNEGELNFATERLAQSDSRAVTIIDVDGDDWLDLVFSHNKRPPAYWHNTGDGQFAREFLSGVAKPLYAINWGDVDGDGDLDLVGAGYDASLLTDYGQEFLTDSKGGVYVYENREEQFALTSLATSAQALALLLLDLNGDGLLDIWVGNDFAVPDFVWYRSSTGWQAAAPLARMSYSTMSLDAGDIDNDGENEVFSTDMKSRGDDSQGEQILRTITDSIDAERDLMIDPQITANVLQSVGTLSDEAEAAGVDATGWSWSGKFGDLNQDGLLDLYVVNGFMEATTFGALPDHELVEENQVFSNLGAGKFAPMPEWGLGSIRSGRGMSMGDLDRDGDLDIVVNNLNSAAQLFENQLCEGHSLQVDLRWLTSLNTRAIGARLVLYTDQGTYTRDVKAASGYISGDPSRIHFGIPNDAIVQQLEIVWPDQTVSIIDDVAIDVIMTVTR
jgi:enediyne biosynthesis protein E4